MNEYPLLEDRIRTVGKDIFARMEGEVPSLFNRKHWTGKLMEWAMKDEEVKLQLFRFVDVLPALKNDDLLIRLLNEYFSDVQDIPLINGIRRIADKGFLPRIAAKLVRANVKSLARQFVAGQDTREALSELVRLRKLGFAVSVDLLGEAVLSDVEAVQYRALYLEMLNFLGPKASHWPGTNILDRDEKGSIPALDVSLKVSSFYSQLDPADWNGSVEETVMGIRPVLQAAMEHGASVTFDMEHYHFKNLTIAIFKNVLEAFPDASFTGIALQAYLKETGEDLQRLIETLKSLKRRATVRLVKGAYWDFETVMARQLGWPVPVFSQKPETDLNYEALSRTLLENIDVVRPAFATHNIRSISHAIAVADRLDLPKEAVEFQVIYGMAEPIRSALEKMGYRVRVYTPIGELIPGMAYLIRRLLENTSNESFLRKSFSEDKGLDELAKPRPIPLTHSDEESDPDSFANEPVTDFSYGQARAEMTAALSRCRTQLNQRIPLVIHGEELWTDREIVSVNPAAPGEIIGTVASATSADAQKAVEKARIGWKTWRETPVERRADYLFQAAAVMRAERFDLVALEILEVGKTWKEADGDVAEAIDFLEYYGRRMTQLAQPVVMGNFPGEQNICTYESKGVGVVIAPWNFPLAICTGMVSAAIVSGNTVIFKPSSLSPVLGWKLYDIFKRVGLPSGVLHFLPGSGEDVGAFLASHRDIDFIAFTGSKDVGLDLVERAGRTLPGQRNVKRVIAEMGGKNAVIIDETADLDEAVKGVVQSALGFQGQKCSACSRVIVLQEAFADFSARLKDAMESIRIGLPEAPGSFMGPVIDQAAVKRIREFAAQGAKDGMVLLDREVDLGGYFVGPVIISEASADSIVCQEEIFGPIVSLISARDFDEALEVANGTPYALTGGIYSRSPAHIRQAEREFRVGNLYVNRKITGALVGRQPFGGFRMSGMGSKAGGPDYLLQFLHPKCVSENTLRRGFAPSPKSETPGSS